jgi:hypothetical protein
MSGIDKRGANTTRSPIQPQPAKLPENIQRKRGQGTYRRFADTVGPSELIPQINADAQSDRSKALRDGGLPIHGSGDNASIIPRDGLTQDQDELYGRT